MSSFDGSPTSYSYMALAAGAGRAAARPSGAPVVKTELTLAPTATRTAGAAAPVNAASGPAGSSSEGDPPAGPAPEPRGEKVIPGSVVGRANPQRVVTTALRVPDGPVRPGQAVTLSLSLEIQTGWHVNSHTPNLEYLIPTKVEFPDPGAPE